MSPKERTRRALAYQAIDHLPTQINYTQSIGRIISKTWGVPTSELSLFLNNHLLRVDLDYKRRTTPDANIIFDWWGVGFNANEEGYFPAINPLADIDDLDLYPWPDPHHPDLLTRAEEQIHNDKGQHFICPNFGFALFERAWSLRGFDNFLMDLAVAPDFAGELLERITEIQLVLVKRFI
jgi:uroporphyrinogen decarboxylase